MVPFSHSIAQDQGVRHVYNRANALLDADELSALLVLADSASRSSVEEVRTMGRVLQARVLGRQGEKSRAYHLLDPAIVDTTHADVLVRFMYSYTRASLLHGLRSFEPARREAGHALELARSMRTAPEEIKALVLLGDIENAQDHYDLALAHFIEAEKVAARGNLVRERCGLLLGRGNVLYHQERFDEALDLYEQGLECANANGLPRLKGKAIYNIASAKYLLQDEQAALGYYREVLSSSIVANDKRLEADVRSQMGLMYDRSGEYVKARTEIGAASAILRSLADTAGEADCQLYLAAAFSGLGDHTQALVAAQRALDLSSANGSVKRMKESEEMLHDQFKALGRYQEALEHLRQSHVWADSLNDVKRGETITRLEVQYDTEKNKQTIKVQGLELERTQASKRASDAQRNIVVGALLGLLVLGGSVYRTMRQKQLLAEQQRQLSDHRVEQVLRDQELRVVNAAMEGQEKERRRIAKDLHDRVGSLLSAVKMQFGALEGRMEKVQESLGGQYQRVTGLLDTAVGEVRRISHDMEHSNLAAFGLASALADLRDAVAVPGKFQVELDLFGLEERLNKRLEIAAYRMVQEALSNALRHSKATHLAIQVTRTPALLNIIVEDDGVGFDPARAAEGMGMANLRARAAEFKGTVRVDAREGRGAAIVIDLPIPEETP